MPLLFLLLLGLFIFAVAQMFTKDTEPPELHKPQYLAWALGLCVLGFNIFAYDTDFGIGWGLFGITTIIAIFLTFEPQKRTAFAWYIAVVGVIAGLLFGFRANEFVQQVNIVVLIASIASLFILRSIDAVQWHGLWKIRTIFQYMGKSLRQIPLVFRSASSVRSETHAGMATIVKTVIFTVVLLLFFAVLLSKADPVFNNMIREVREQAIGRSVLSIVLALALVVNLTVRFHKNATDTVPTLRWFGHLELFVPTLALSLLFGLFLFVQAKYLFASDAAFKALDMTYADYVRQGFMELLTATFFGCVVAYMVIVKQREVSHPKHRIGLQAVSAVLIVELFALLASALKRDWMYMDTYGLTRVRIIGEIFLAWLAGILLLLLVFALWQHMKEKLLIMGALALSTIVFLYVNVTNMDAKIAAAMPPRNEAKDDLYIASLSADAIDGWVEMTNRFQQTVDRLKTLSPSIDTRVLATTKSSAQQLSAKVSQLVAQHGSGATWQTYNKSNRTATNVAAINKVQEIADCTVREIEDYQFLRSLDLSEDQYNRDATYTSPFTERTWMHYRNLETITIERVYSGSGSVKIESCL